jgi:LysM repeat protein
MYDRYKIKDGEDLKKIAEKFNTTVEVLKDINNLYYADSLREGTDIIVPKNAEQYFDFYTIENGDNLYNIAKKYNINPDLLASMNGINKEDYIYPKQEILIPKAEYSYYITKDGDTLQIVSNMFKVTSDKLISENSAIYLLEGQILVNKRK